MAYNNQHSIRELPPKALFHFLLVAGLAALAYAIITQNLIAAIAVICFPLASIILIYGLQTPRFTAITHDDHKIICISCI